MPAKSFMPLTTALFKSIFGWNNNASELQEIPQEISQEVTQQISQEISQEVAQQISQEISPEKLMMLKKVTSQFSATCDVNEIPLVEERSVNFLALCVGIAAGFAGLSGLGLYLKSKRTKTNSAEAEDSSEDMLITPVTINLDSNAMIAAENDGTINENKELNSGAEIKEDLTQAHFEVTNNVEPSQIISQPIPQSASQPSKIPIQIFLWNLYFYFQENKGKSEDFFMQDLNISKENLSELKKVTEGFGRKDKYISEVMINPNTNKKVVDIFKCLGLPENRLICERYLSLSDTLNKLTTTKYRM